ncbi:MAG: DMT family transporter [Anaerovoracaceae bacterium]|jgi:drug/metabolite transporter (DMT)-like permease
MNRNLKGSLIFLLTAIIWGAAFVTQKSGSEYVDPFTVDTIRSFLGAATLLPFIMRGRKKEKEAGTAADRKTVLTGGIVCGLGIFAGMTLQQIGIMYTTAGKAGFLTTIYVVLVPILGLFIGKKIRPLMWLCVVLSIMGLYLLCADPGTFTIGKGDLIVICSALGFSFQMLAADYYTKRMDSIFLSFMQFLVCGILSLPLMLIFEHPTMSAITACAPQLLYLGIMSSGIAYTLQIVGQQYAEPTVASLILSLESLFAALSGALFLGETMTGREITGCALMLAAAMMSQLPASQGPAEDNI